VQDLDEVNVNLTQEGIAKADQIETLSKDSKEKNELIQKVNKLQMIRHVNI